MNRLGATATSTARATVGDAGLRVSIALAYCGVVLGSQLRWPAPVNGRGGAQGAWTRVSAVSGIPFASTSLRILHTQRSSLPRISPVWDMRSGVEAGVGVGVGVRMPIGVGVGISGFRVQGYD